MHLPDVGSQHRKLMLLIYLWHLKDCFWPTGRVQEDNNAKEAALVPVLPLSCRASSWLTKPRWLLKRCLPAINRQIISSAVPLLIWHLHTLLVLKWGPSCRAELLKHRKSRSLCINFSCQDDSNKDAVYHNTSWPDNIESCCPSLIRLWRCFFKRLQLGQEALFALQFLLK